MLEANDYHLCKRKSDEEFRPLEKEGWKYLAESTDWHCQEGVNGVLCFWSCIDLDKIIIDCTASPFNKESKLWSHVLSFKFSEEVNYSKRVYAVHFFCVWSDSCPSYTSDSIKTPLIKLRFSSFIFFMFSVTLLSSDCKLYMLLSLLLSFIVVWPHINYSKAKTENILQK